MVVGKIFPRVCSCLIPWNKCLCLRGHCIAAVACLHTSSPVVPNASVYENHTGCLLKCRFLHNCVIMSVRVHLEWGPSTRVLSTQRGAVEPHLKKCCFGSLTTQMPCALQGEMEMVFRVPLPQSCSGPEPMVNTSETAGCNERGRTSIGTFPVRKVQHN